MVGFVFVYLVLMVLLDLLFVLSPVKGYGYVNVLLGLFSWLFAGAGLNYAGEIPFFPYFNVFVAVVGVVCMLRVNRGG
jgi:hypothetical protein